jgi:hypothetical protein
VWYKHGERDTYEPQPVGIGVLLDVFPQIPARHPTRNELELRGGGDTEKRIQRLGDSSVSILWPLDRRSVTFVSGDRQKSGGTDSTPLGLFPEHLQCIPARFDTDH